MTKSKQPYLKTSLTLPPELWRKFRVQCLTEGRPAHVALAELLEKYLATKKGGR
jgi:hypothetical protein